MSNDMGKPIRLVPGEPVPQFGGLTPEQMGAFAGQVEQLVFAVFGSMDGAASLYNHLLARMFLDVEEHAGPEALEQCVACNMAALRDELDGQRKIRTRYAAEQLVAGQTNKELN